MIGHPQCLRFYKLSTFLSQRKECTSRVERRQGRKQWERKNSLTHSPLLFANFLSFPSHSQMVVQSFLEEDREDHDKEMEEQMMLKEVCMCISILLS